MVAFFGHYEPARLFMRVMQLPGTLDEFGAGIFLAKLLDGRAAARSRRGRAMDARGARKRRRMLLRVLGEHVLGSAVMVIFWRTSLGIFFLCVVAAAVMLPTVAWTWPLRPIRYLGEVSYGIYLWHLFAIKACLSADLAPLPMLARRSASRLRFAAASWHLFEKPILRFGRRIGTDVARPQPAAVA